MTYINLYWERLLQQFLRSQPFVIDNQAPSVTPWIPAVQIHKGLEKPTPGDLEGGVSIAQKKTPLIEVKCEMAQPVKPNFRGNWNVEAEICITNSTRDTSDDVHEDRVNQVLGLFYDDQLFAAIAAVNLAFWYARCVPGETGHRIEGISFHSYGRFEFVSACAQNLNGP